MFHPPRGFSGDPGSLGRSGVAEERCVALRWSVVGRMPKHGARRHLGECLVLAIPPPASGLSRTCPINQRWRSGGKVATQQHGSTAAWQHGSMSERLSTEIRDPTPTPETCNPGRLGPDAEPPN